MVANKGSGRKEKEKKKKIDINFKGQPTNVRKDGKPPHYFLAEELLVPGCNHNDTMRINLWNNHQAQMVVLDEPEPPKVFTRFENQIGMYSTAYKKAKNSFKVLSKMKRNNYNYLLLIQYNKSKKYDVIEVKPCERITEHYGYKYHNSEFKTRKNVKKGSIIRRSTAYDKDLNFSYGVNLNTVFHSIKNLTYEDAIVISESTKKLFSTNYIHEVIVPINTNDIFINLYGDDEKYKGFPNIGDEINQGLLSAVRRLNFNSALFQFSDKNFSKVMNEDIQYFAEGKVVDIEIFSNTNLENIEKFSYNKQVINLLRKNSKYHKQVVEVLGAIVEDENKEYCDDLAFFYERSLSALEPDIRWAYNKSDFDYLLLKFIILEKNELNLGSKITNRHGNKGVISKILPDKEMPITKDGRRADIILNELGVINRTNLGQLFEVEVNFIAENIRTKIERCIKKGKCRKAQEYFFRFYSYLYEEQFIFLKNKLKKMKKQEKIEFFEEVIKEGLFIHSPPFFGNLNFDFLKALYLEFDDFADKNKRIHKNIVPYEFCMMINKMVMGEMYFIRLKHDAFSKYSARSTGNLNLKNVPAKSKVFKEHNNLFNMTPIRMGEQENANMLTLNNAKEIKRFINLYSANTEDRQKVIEELLSSNPFLIEKIELGESKNNVTEIIEHFLKTLGLEIKDGE